VPTCERVPERSRGLVGGTHVQMCPRTKRDVMQGTRTGGGEERGKKRRERYLGVGCRENTEGGNVLGKEEEQSAVRVVYFLARGRGWLEAENGWEGIGTPCELFSWLVVVVEFRSTSPRQNSRNKAGSCVGTERSSAAVCMHSYGELTD
jgi:hypothetical protein